MFESKFKDFMEKNPNITMLSLAWSLYWRLGVVMFVVAFVVGMLSEM
jgi:hypothetical protein